MLKAAIEKILSLSELHVIDIGGETYADKKLDRIPHERTACPLEVHTLTAILDYITTGCDEMEDDIDRKFVIHVADHEHVNLYRELNSDKTRECLLECSVNPKTFPFGRWLDIESFIIAMQAHFVPSHDVDALIKLVGNIVDENSVTTADDGVSQKVTARSGISLVKQVEVPNPISLAPYRTFNEIEQPESTFVFRVRKGANGVEAALFTADGNAWVNDAIRGIRDYLASELSEVELAGERNVMRTEGGAWPQNLREEVIILA